MNKTIIGFAGRKRAGKTCLSSFLTQKYNGTIVTVADALKRLCCDLMGLETIDELNRLKDNGTSWSFNKKDIPVWAETICKQVFGQYSDNVYNDVAMMLEGIGTYNVRELLQFVGTDIIRKYKPDWHVDKMVEAISNADTDLVCVDDVRFPNERKAIEKLGGKVFFIIRPDLTIGVSNHESETSLTWPEFNDDSVILNMFSKQFMFDEFDAAFKNDFFFIISCPIFKKCYVDTRKCNEKLGYKPLYNNIGAKEYNLIKNVLVNTMKNHNGCIVLHPETKNVMKFYEQMLYQKCSNSYELSTITLWNPFIIENIKAWL